MRQPCQTVVVSGEFPILVVGEHHQSGGPGKFMKNVNIFKLFIYISEWR